jgi:hypothetical protein
LRTLPWSSWVENDIRFASLQGKGLRQVDFVFDGNEMRALEQNPDTKSRWAQMARAGKKVMQFLGARSQRLVKTGGLLVRHARYYWLLPAEGHLSRRPFDSILRMIVALPLPNEWRSTKESELSVQRPSRTEECQWGGLGGGEKTDRASQRNCPTSGQGNLRLTLEGGRHMVLRKN